MRLDELGQTFVIRLVIRLWCKDGHKTHYLLLCDLNNTQQKIVRLDG